MAYLGIDLGTSGVKAIVCNTAGDVIASHSASLTVSTPQPLWSEQAPKDWWHALDTCMQALKKQGVSQSIEAIAIAGQMHGAVLLDEHNNVLRPAILWNDGRSALECEELMAEVPDAMTITGNLIMPGFTAPKLKWVAKNEPNLFAKIAKVLLPKDYLRFLLTGTYYSDMSDAAGTSWLDTAERDWSAAMLLATGLSVEQMPSLCEGPDITGHLLPSIAQQWGMQSVPVMGGAGDNAAGAIGSGITQPGHAMLSLGTSGVIFAVTDRFMSNPQSALHSFCHALPNTWHVMSVHLSAASCLQWFAGIAAQGDVSVLVEELSSTQIDETNAPFFLPYLSGERTPHNNPKLGGEFIGLTASTSRAEMTYAILEGVAFALNDGLNVINASDVFPAQIAIIGGGAKSQFWRQLITDVLGVTCTYHQGGEVGPALGAARIAMLGANPTAKVDTVCPIPDIVATHQVQRSRHEQLKLRYHQFNRFANDANQRNQ